MEKLSFIFPIFLPWSTWFFVRQLNVFELCVSSFNISSFMGPRPRQYDTICWELNLISGFFAFFWLIVWADRINKCGWCLAGGRGYWLNGPHQIPSVSWMYYHSLCFHIYQIASFVPGILCPLYSYYKRWGDGLGRGWLIYNRVWVLSCSFCFCFLCFFCFCFFHLCFCPFFSHVLCPFFKWLEHFLFIFFVSGLFN